MPGLYVPQGELETLMVAKEAVFGQLSTTNAKWHCFTKFTPKISINPVARAPRASLAAPYPGTGGRTVSASLDAETDADTIPQLLAYTLGAQAAPTTTLVNTTLNGATIIGATTFILASTIAVYPGMALMIDTSTNAETLTVESISGINTITTTTGATKAHASGVIVTLTATGAYLTVMKLGTPLPSFSVQVNRPGSVCTDYLGTCVDQLSLSIATKQGLSAQFSLLSQDALTDGSPVSATLSTLNPYVYEQQNTFAQIGGEVTGAGTGASLLSIKLTINNNLNKDWFTFGSGNRVRSFPEQERKISGSMTLGFETAAQLNNFNAARLGGNLPPISALIPLIGTDQIGSSGVYYAMAIYLPRVFLSAHSTADDTSKAIEQTLTFECAESTPSANDQVSVYSINSNSAIY